MNEASMEKMAELKQQLTPENKEYVRKLMFFMNAHMMFGPNAQLENLVLEILQDIVQAQAEGVSAADYFGKQPREVLMELVQDLAPKTWGEKFKVWGKPLLGLAYFPFLFIFSMAGEYLNVFIVLTMFISTAVTFLVVMTAMTIQGKRVYKEKKRIKYMMPIVAVATGLITLLALIPILIWEPETHIYIPPMVRFPALVMGVLISMYQVGAKKNFFERAFYIPLMVFALFLGMQGFLFHLAATRAFMLGLPPLLLHYLGMGLFLVVFLAVYKKVIMRSGEANNWREIWQLIREVNKL